MPPNKDAPGYLGTTPGLICLPPISEDLQLVWTQAAQTSDLDGNQHLLQTFSYFPYPSLSDLALLCLHHGLHMEKVKAWFMAQRLRCGISWSAEEIEETRARLIYHQDQLHFGSLLIGNDDCWNQAGKSQEYPQAISVYNSSKYPENQLASVNSSNHYITAQEARELGRITPDAWKLKENLFHHGKAQENGELSQTPMHLHNTKDTFSGGYLPTTSASLERKIENSHITVWDLPGVIPQPSEATASVVNGGHHPMLHHPAVSSVKAVPSTCTTTTSAVESHSLQNCQYPAGNQHQPSGQSSETVRRPRRKTKEQLDLLKSFFLHCQWAKREDYCQLEKITGLPRSEIIQWFGDTRYALKHGQLKWFRDNAPQSTESASSLPPHSLYASHSSTSPLERYWATHQRLQEKDITALCHESGMDAEQVLKWFSSHSPAPCEVEVCLGDEDEIDEEVAAAMIKEEDEDYEEEEDYDVDVDDDEEGWVS